MWLLVGACMVPGGGHVLLLVGACMVVSRGACVVAGGGACVVAGGGYAWLLVEGMHGCWQGVM